MPSPPTPRPPPTVPAPDATELTVQVYHADGTAELLWVLAPAPQGMVRVKEWSPANWASPPLERLLSADTVYERLRRASRERQRVTPEIMELRAWLDATGR